MSFNPQTGQGQHAVPRMLVFALLAALLFVGALWAQANTPGTLLAVSLYKAHLMALGGWGGYWLDRALFPYDRPHQYLEDDEPDWSNPALAASARGDTAVQSSEVEQLPYVQGFVIGNAFSFAMLRRAVIVAACLLCVGLGA